MNFYIAGIIVGLIVGVIVFLASRFIFKKMSCQYDERQMIGRGKAFQAGFFTLLIAGAVYNIWNFVAPLPGSSFLWNICILLLGVTVFAVTAIHYDAYVGVNDTPQRFLTAGVCFIISMGLLGFTNLHGGRPEQHTLGILNLAVCAVWIILVIALLAHNRRQKEDE